MENLDSASLLELILMSEASIDYQVEFWLTVTFATIVASFAARKLLSKIMRSIISALYVMATFVFVSRWYYSALDIFAFTEALASQGIESSPAFGTALARMVLMGFGTFTTLYFVNFSTKGRKP